MTLFIGWYLIPTILTILWLGGVLTTSIMFRGTSYVDEVIGFFPIPTLIWLIYLSIVVVNALMDGHDILL